MKRGEAYQLANSLADSGFSCSVAVGIHDDLAPRETCSVRVESISLDQTRVLRLIEIAETHNTELRLPIGSVLTFKEKRA